MWSLRMLPMNAVKVRFLRTSKIDTLRTAKLTLQKSLRKQSVERESENLGYTGKQVIDPSQLPVAEEALTPPEVGIEWAKELMKRFEEHQASEVNAFSKDFDHEKLDEMGSPIPVSFNLAAYANRSLTLQKLIDLGVNLYKIEQSSREACEFIVKLDFDRDIKRYIVFLHDIGIPSDSLAHFITEYPMIFDEEIENLKSRLKYMRSKGWNKRAIIKILTSHPKFISKSLFDVDAALGFLQHHFSFSGIQIRSMTEKWPQVVDVPHQRLRICHFSMKEEMGFSAAQIRAILVQIPSLTIEPRNQVVKRFDLIHNEIGFTHKVITYFPEALKCEHRLMKSRHLYLTKLKRAQYDAQKPGYVPLIALTDVVDDAQFCDKYAKTTAIDFNLFLKTV